MSNLPSPIRVTPVAEIVPLGPETDEVAMYLDGEWVGIAHDPDAARLTLVTLVMGILAQAYGANRATSHDLPGEGR